MRTACQDTSIAAFKNYVVPYSKAGQEQRIIDFITRHGPSTIGEIAKGLDMEKSTVSARQNGLRKAGALVFGIERHCAISGIKCKPLWFPVAQMEMFQ